MTKTELLGCIYLIEDTIKTLSQNGEIRDKGDVIDLLEKVRGHFKTYVSPANFPDGRKQVAPLYKYE